MIHRFDVVLDGWAGGPGINTFWFKEGAAAGSETLQDIADGIRSVYVSLMAYLVPGGGATVSPEVTEHNEATGELTAVRIVTPGARVGFDGGPAKMSRADMGLVRLGTDNVVAGRRLQGRHFLGPLGANGISDAGTTSVNFKSSVPTAYQGLVDGWGEMRLAVWHRPKPGLSDGVAHFVTGVTLADKPGILRSRRD